MRAKKNQKFLFIKGRDINIIHSVWRVDKRKPLAFSWMKPVHNAPDFIPNCEPDMFVSRMTADGMQIWLYPPPKKQTDFIVKYSVLREA